MEVLEAIHTRRSVRAFTDDPVTEEQIEVLLRAAMAAPSAKNAKPWRFVVVRDRSLLDRLSQATRYSAPIGRANVGIVILAEPSSYSVEVDLWMVDCALAGENLMLAAHSQGLGSVWLASWPYEDFMSSIRAILGVPDGVVPVAMFAVGVPAAAGPVVDRFHPEWVYRDRWGAE